MERPAAAPDGLIIPLSHLPGLKKGFLVDFRHFLKDDSNFIG
jgi:hypothetical protein